MLWTLQNFKRNDAAVIQRNKNIKSSDRKLIQIDQQDMTDQMNPENMERVELDDDYLQMMDDIELEISQIEAEVHQDQSVSEEDED